MNDDVPNKDIKHLLDKSSQENTKNDIKKNL